MSVIRAAFFNGWLFPCRLALLNLFSTTELAARSTPLRVYVRVWIDESLSWGHRLSHIRYRVALRSFSRSDRGSLSVFVFDSRSRTYNRFLRRKLLSHWAISEPCVKCFLSSSNIFWISECYTPLLCSACGLLHHVSRPRAADLKYDRPDHSHCNSAIACKSLNRVTIRYRYFLGRWYERSPAPPVSLQQPAFLSGRRLPIFPFTTFGPITALGAMPPPSPGCRPDLLRWARLSSHGDYKDTPLYMTYAILFSQTRSGLLLQISISLGVRL